MTTIRRSASRQNQRRSVREVAQQRLDGAPSATEDPLPTPTELSEGPHEFSVAADVVNLTNGFIFSGGDGASVAFWVNTDVDPDPNSVYFFGVSSNISSHYVAGDVPDLVFGGFVAGVTRNAPHASNGLWSLAVDTWQHHAITYNNTTNETKWYVDGTQRGGASTLTTPVDWPAGISLGTRRILGGVRDNGGAQSIFDGTIADFRIHNGVVYDADTIAAIHAAALHP